jgi:hypothetical protein
VSTPWQRAADLLEQEPDGPDADLNREIVEAAGRLDWQDAAARLVGCLLEQRPYPGEVEAAAQVAAWLPSLRPQGWEQAPRGAELVEAVLAAYGASPWHPDPGRPTGPR